MEGRRRRSFGWVGFAFADQAGDDVRILEVAKEPGGDCVSPSTDDTIADGSYPLSRSLYIYVNAADGRGQRGAGVVRRLLPRRTCEAIVEAADYVALPDDQASETVERWDARTTGWRPTARVR